MPSEVQIGESLATIGMLLQINLFEVVVEEALVRTGRKSLAEIADRGPG